MTGMSFSGKCAVLDVLRQRGYRVVDDDGGWELPDGTWDEQRMDALLGEHAEVFVSGGVERQSRFYEKFDDVVLVSVPLEVALARANHPSVSSSNQSIPDCQPEDQQREITEYFYTVEPLLRSVATMELDGSASADDLADVLERLVDDNSS